MRPGHSINLPIDLSFEKTNQTLLANQSGTKFVVLKMPKCELNPVEVNNAFFIVPSGYYLSKHEVLVPNAGYIFQEQNWYVGNIKTKINLPQIPPEHFLPLNPLSKNQICRPDLVLSNDGLWLAWVEKNPDINDIFIYGHGTEVAPKNRTVKEG